jgi:uncharacterized protein
MDGETRNDFKEPAAPWRTSHFIALHDPSKPIHKAASRLEPYFQAIVERIRPEKIILFGSYAYGVPTEHSDFDLLIVRSGIESEKESNLEIRRALRHVPGPRPPFTFLSKTPEEIDAALAGKDPFIEDIMDQGIELYAA